MRGELETEKNCNILTPQLLWRQQHFFAVLLGCSTGVLGAQPQLEDGSHSSIFSPTDQNFLSAGLYNNLTSTYFLRASQFAHNSTLRQSRLSLDPLISSTGCTCYFFLFLFLFFLFCFVPFFLRGCVILPICNCLMMFPKIN